MELEQLQGQVLNVVFRNEKNQYTVLVLQREDDGEEATVVGMIPLVSSWSTGAGRTAPAMGPSSGPRLWSTGALSPRKGC